MGAGEELTYAETAVVEERVSAKSVSLLWPVMSALLLKIAPQRTTGGSYWGETRLDESQRAGDSYSEPCLEVGVTL